MAKNKNRLKKQLYLNLSWAIIFFILFWFEDNMLRLKVFSTVLILAILMINSLVIWGEM